MLAQTIKEARKRLGLTQKQVAAKIGINYQNYQRWETGTAVPSGKNLIALVIILGIQLQPHTSDRNDKCGSKKD